MPKKAALITLRQLIVFVLIAFVLIGLLTGVFQKADAEVFANEFLAKDLSLTIESLISVPGDVILDYSQNLANRTVEIEKNKVIVFEKGKEVKKRTFPFISSEKIKINYGRFEPDPDKELKLRFIKSGDTIIITKDLSEMPQVPKLSCPYFSTKDINWQNKEVLIGVSHRDNDNDLGHVSDNLKEAEIVEKIADYLRAMKSTMPNIKFTRESGINVVGEREEKITGATEVVISLNIGSYPPALNEIRAYINPAGEKSRESNKLACTIINAILENDEFKDITFTSANIMPATKENPGYSMLEAGNNKIAISLEIGNINNEQGKKLLLRTADIGKSINQGLSDYYS